MRISKQRLSDITGLSLPYAQARWFKKHLGAAVPYDERGPIITEQAFEALVAKSCGIAQQAQDARPEVQLRRKRK